MTEPMCLETGYVPHHQWVAAPPEHVLPGIGGCWFNPLSLEIVSASDGIVAYASTRWIDKHAQEAERLAYIKKLFGGDITENWKWEKGGENTEGGRNWSLMELPS